MNFHLIIFPIIQSLLSSEKFGNGIILFSLCDSLGNFCGIFHFSISVVEYIFINYSYLHMYNNMLDITKLGNNN